MLGFWQGIVYLKQHHHCADMLHCYLLQPVEKFILFFLRFIAVCLCKIHASDKEGKVFEIIVTKLFTMSSKLHQGLYDWLIFSHTIDNTDNVFHYFIRKLEASSEISTGVSSKISTGASKQTFPLFYTSDTNRLFHYFIYLITQIISLYLCMSKQLK